MRSRRRWIHVETSGEFELDLAPLLAVMVKLVPVLLVSSAFVQLMVVETELPQVVKEAITQNDQKPTVKLRIEADPQNGLRIVTAASSGQESAQVVPLKSGAFDYPGLHSALVELKRAHPEVFRLDLVPQGNVAYGDLVRIMDEARRARDSQVRFPAFDSKENKAVETPYMFPEVVFINSLEG